MPSRVLFNRKQSYTSKTWHSYDVVDSKDHKLARLRFKSDGSMYLNNAELDPQEVVVVLEQLALKKR